MLDYLKSVMLLTFWVNPYFWVLVAGFASYRISHLLVTDLIGRKIRNFFNVQEDFDQDLQPNFIAKALVCYWCTSVWVSFFVTLVMIFSVPVVMLPFGIAGIALFLENITER